MKAWWRRVRPLIISDLLYGIVRIIGKSLRLRVWGFEESSEINKGVIYCGWHGRSLIPANYFKGMGFFAIISHSRDGEVQTRIFKNFGFKVIRGSTGRGGARALIESIRVLREGGRMAVTPDGPRGPLGVVQPGVVMMAMKSGAALVPVGSAAKRFWSVPTWDHYMIPWLFSRATFVIGDPIYVSPSATEEEAESARVELEQAIGAVQALAESRI